MIDADLIVDQPNHFRYCNKRSHHPEPLAPPQPRCQPQLAQLVVQTLMLMSIVNKSSMNLSLAMIYIFISEQIDYIHVVNIFENLCALSQLLNIDSNSFQSERFLGHAHG